MKNWKKIILAFALVASVGFAAPAGKDVKVGFVGPSGQGNLRTTQSDGTMIQEITSGGIVSNAALVVTGTATLAGAVPITGDLTLSADLITPAASVTVTNNETITVASYVNDITGIGQLNNFTNAVTLANATDGQWAVFVVNSASTNLFKITDGGINSLAGDFVGDNGDTLTVFGDGTNWVETSRSNN